jgi:asparagine synthase (glutamine-hydrolysing)
VTGICGWVGGQLPAEENRAVIERMAAPLSQAGSRFSPLFGKQGGICATGRADLAAAGEDSGFGVALLGRPRWTEDGPAQRAHAEGMSRTIARLFQERGPKLLDSLAGDFCLAIINLSRDELFVAIDRAGIHSVTYTEQRQRLVFASTAAALNQHPGLVPEINPQSLYDYVYFHMVPGPQTIFAHQLRLPPGGCLHWKNGVLEQRRYWQPSYSEHEEPSFADLKAEFRELLQKSVREACGAELNVGTFLSGGTDSSTLTGTLGKTSGARPRTYSIGFRAADAYDESGYAQLAARHFNAEHHEYFVTPDDVVEVIPELARAFDQPFGNASAVPSYCCARFARSDGIALLLAGDGGDELFGGNARYAKQFIFSLYERIPRTLRRGLLEPALLSSLGGKHLPGIAKVASYVEQARMPMPSRLESYNLLHRIGAAKVFCEDFLAAVDCDAPARRLDASYRDVRAQSLINRMLALDWQYTLADNDLPKVTRTCDLAGVGVAFPLLDDRMVEFSQRLAPNWKLRGTRLCYFFKQALSDFLPPEIIAKPKHGFGLPFGVWCQSHPLLQALANDNLASLRNRGIVRKTFIDELMTRRVDANAGYYGTLVWVLMMLELWYQQHWDSLRRSDTAAALSINSAATASSAIRER